MTKTKKKINAAGLDCIQPSHPSLNARNDITSKSPAGSNNLELNSADDSDRSIQIGPICLVSPLGGPVAGSAGCPGLQLLIGFDNAWLFRLRGIPLGRDLHHDNSENSGLARFRDPQNSAVRCRLATQY